MNEHYGDLPQNNNNEKKIDINKIFSRKSMDDRSKEWIIEKNVPNISKDDINSLNRHDKSKIKKIKKAPKKTGRYVEVDKFTTFYIVSLLDFLPFFIGHFYSLVRLFVAYGDAKRTINFNKKMMWDFKNNLFISLIFSFIFWPILIITIFIFYPYIVYDASEVTYGWQGLFDQLAINGVNGLGEGLKIYIDRAVMPLLEPKYFPSTLFVWVIISMFNIQTFLFYFLYKFDRKILFEIQKNSVREQISKFEIIKKEHIKEKNNKMKNIINIVSSDTNNTNQVQNEQKDKK